MAADPNLFQQYLVAPKSVLDYSNDMDKREMNQLALAGQRRQNSLADITIQQQQEQAQLGLRKQNALQAVFSNPDAQDPIKRENMLLSNPLTVKEGQDMQTARLNAGRIGAETAKTQGEADAGAYDLRVRKANKAISDIANLSSPQDAIASLNSHLQAGDIDPQKYQSVLATLQPALQDPSQFGQWKRKMVIGIMDAKDQIAATAPKITMTNTGGSIVPVNENADAGPVGQVAGAQPIKTTVSPDAVLSSQTSRANNKENIQKDLQIAGLGPDGQPGQNVEQMAQAIANYKQAPITGFGLAKPAGQTVMRRVMELNPNYDETTYVAKNQAAKGFADGPKGDSLRSVSVANNHLDQLGELADGMNNGNTQIVNKVVNFFKTQTGDPSINNFDAIKNIVGQEVVKAIVAGGGSAGERDEAAKAFSSASSPTQLKDVIKHYRMVMGAQQSALLEQRRAAGLPDSTLPNYSGLSGSGNSDLHAKADAIINGGK